MSDSLPTVWPLEEHTRAKHLILQQYLSGFMPILANQVMKVGRGNAFVRYIDGFAGPGVYEKGEKGSPILALEAAIDHPQDFPVPIELTFVEDDKERL